MVLAGRTQMMDSYPVPEALERMKAMGLEGVEVCVEDIKFGIRGELLDPPYLRDAAATLRELGFRAWSYSYHADYITNDEVLTRTVRTIELTRELDTDVFVFSGRRRDKRADAAREWEALVSRTRPLVEAAQANGVRLALETEPGFYCGTSAELIRLIDELDSPALGANMDIGHAFLCDPDPLAAIRSLGGRVYHAHLENMRRGVHDHRLPDDGDMDLGSFLAALEEVGLAGPAAFDLYGYDYEAVLPRAIAHVRALMGGAARG